MGSLSWGLYRGGFTVGSFTASSFCRGFVVVLGTVESLLLNILGYLLWGLYNGMFTVRFFRGVFAVCIYYLLSRSLLP